MDRAGKALARGGVIGLAGNPNVGKSTVFNNLTGLRQHTGNWSGKTVINARGNCEYNGKAYEMFDLPGCYSLITNSAEEESARDFIFSGGADVIIVVCDATCLERNMNLVLQILEITGSTIVCVNFMDEAAKKKITLDLKALSERLGVPVVGTSARDGKGIGRLMEAAEELIKREEEPQPFVIRYPNYIEEAIAELIPFVSEQFGNNVNCRRLALSLIEGVGGESEQALTKLRRIPEISEERLNSDIATALVETAEEICRGVVSFGNGSYLSRDMKIDALLTGKRTAFPIMLLMLTAVFWITLYGANYPSALIARFLFWIEDLLLAFFIMLDAPKLLYEPLVFGVYRVLAWVVSVMLPPMAIFFPLFTLLEDAGFLPRIAFNLDKCFKKCKACGKQALTMCMGFGCNAVGVTGCRIIDSPRERLLAILTNSFVPCNGRFPALIAIITMFFVGASAGFLKTVLSAVFLAGIIVLGVFATLAASRLLSATVLKGVPSSFTLELPPYRRPQIGRVIVRSVLDRTLFVLFRAVAVAAPAGLLIWLMANITIGGGTILARCAGFLNPFAVLLGMDGVILLAFILGFPANEIVIPLIIMAYCGRGTIAEAQSLTELRQLLVDNGWTWVTAVCVMLFTLFHWPCSTTCLTIKKETWSIKWAVIGILLPTAAGIAVCFLFATAARLAGF